METTFKIVLDKRRAIKNGTYPLRMRLYQGRDYKSYSLGIESRELDWDEQMQVVKITNPSHKLHNLQISSHKTKLQKSIFLNEDETEAIPPEDLIHHVKVECKKSNQRSQIFSLTANVKRELSRQTVTLLVSLK